MRVRWKKYAGVADLWLQVNLEIFQANDDDDCCWTEMQLSTECTVSVHGGLYNLTEESVRIMAQP